MYQFIIPVLIVGLTLGFIITDYFNQKERVPKRIATIVNPIVESYPRTLIIYQLLFICSGLMLTIPSMLFYPTMLNIILMVIFNFGMIPFTVFVYVHQRFYPRQERKMEPSGVLFEKLVIDAYKDGTIHEFLKRQFDMFEREKNMDESLQSEYEAGKDRILSRDDEVCRAFRNAFSKWNQTTIECG